jgi:hypothetical protein
MRKPPKHTGPGRPKLAKTAKQKRTDPVRSARAKKRVQEKPHTAPKVKPENKFQPGQSANPGGRKTNFSTKLSRAYERKLEEMMPHQQCTVAEAIVEKVIGFILNAKKLDRAILGAAQEAGDRSEGKPTQKIITENSNPFAGRSYEEVDYFAKFGHWPEEAQGVGSA